MVQEGRRAAAPVQLRDAPLAEQRRALANLLRQRVQIAVSFMQLARHDLIAAAEIAELMAERDMNVERQRALRIARHGTQKIRLAVAVAEFKRSRV